MSRFHAQSVGRLDATYMSYRPSSPAHVVRKRADVSLLAVSDRACLRLLEYTRVCTASQLATLVYPSLRTALRRTRKLSQENLVTRESLPPERGGIPLAYRLSSSGRRRIHLNAYRSPGLITTRHSLDGVEFVASLVRHDPGLVQLWWPEWLIPGYDWGVNPDHLVVIDTGEASALILVEVDESTERPPVIRDRLHAYAKLFEDHRVGWHLLWVANSPERLARLRQIAGPTKLALLSGRCWGVAIDDVSDRGADAEVLAIGAKDEPRPLREIATDPKARRSEYEVGSALWISLLANGGKEDIGPFWSGVERGHLEPVPVPAVIDPVVEEATEPAAIETQATSIEDVEAQPPESPQSRPAAVPTFDLNDMTSLDLAVLITARYRTVRQALKAASLLADRHEWHHLEECANMLCHSYEPAEQLLGLHLIRRYLASHGNLSPAFLLLVRSLARQATRA
jgi:Replication-relaxation